jgi:hypothetical protein
MVEPSTDDTGSVAKDLAPEASPAMAQPADSPRLGTDVSTLVDSLRRDITSEKQKVSSLFFVIGGVISFEAGRLLTPIHELFAMICAVVAVIFSIYGLFNYFDAFRRS